MAVERLLDESLISGKQDGMKVVKVRYQICTSNVCLPEPSWLYCRFRFLLTFHGSLNEILFSRNLVSSEGYILSCAETQRVGCTFSVPIRRTTANFSTLLGLLGRDEQPPVFFCVLLLDVVFYDRQNCTTGGNTWLQFFTLN